MHLGRQRDTVAFEALIERHQAAGRGQSRECWVAIPTSKTSPSRFSFGLEKRRSLRGPRQIHHLAALKITRNLSLTRCAAPSVTTGAGPNDPERKELPVKDEMTATPDAALLKENCKVKSTALLPTSDTQAWPGS